MLCPECLVALSPRFVVLDDTETNKQKEILRAVYFAKNKLMQGDKDDI